MRKTMMMALVILALVALPSTALADVIRNSGGHPVGSESNLGSVTGQANRSANGTLMKSTNDGIRLFPGFWE